MNIRNKYCLLSELTQAQIDKLVGLIPDREYYFDFNQGETHIGFDENGESGTWDEPNAATIPYKEMLSLLGEEEELVPHVHQKEIIAWANGEEIEVLIDGLAPATWRVPPSPRWGTENSYRIKPKLTPTQLRIQKLTEELAKLKEQHNVECGINKVMGT
tara:strand:- start:460 stop:936 length:477 start_codon:yes stop_codon:yes gene_type:complete